MSTVSTIPITAFQRLHDVLKAMNDYGASDLHISVGGGFRIRVKGELLPFPDGGTLTPVDIAAISGSILLAGRKCSREDLPHFLETLTDFDCAYASAGIGRYRVNIACQRKSLSLVLRHIPYQLPTIEGLGLPRVISEIALAERGLVLVTGTTGSGKTTTLAAMINHINQSRKGKIVTIEDPIEFLYKDASCTITQRECGSDTESFSKALRAALRQDPDIILVGEMRDRETIDIAIRAAETGHLVLSTLHTSDAPKTISRIVSVFDANEQTAVRMRLGETVCAVISQRLLRRADGTGRVVACEIMRLTKSTQDCILDPAKTDTMKDFIEDGKDIYGMQTFDQHLTELYRSGVINLETAKSAATSPSDFERNLKFI